VQIAAATPAGNRLRQTVHENWAKSLKKVAIWRQNESQLYTTMTLSANEIKVVPYYGWWRGSVVERRSLAGELSLSCA